MIVLKTMQQCQEKDNKLFMTILKWTSHELNTAANPANPQNPQRKTKSCNSNVVQQYCGPVFNPISLIVLP